MEQWRAEQPAIAAMGDKLLVDDDGSGAANRRKLAELSLLPDHAAGLIGRHVRVVRVGQGSVADFPEFADAARASGRPRGYEEGMTLSDAFGCYDTENRAVLIGDDGSSASVSAILHEMGHALDDADGQWHLCYEMEELHREIHDRLPPYLQQGGPGGAAGCSELFAELFAEVLYDRERAARLYGRGAVDFMECDVLGIRESGQS